MGKMINKHQFFIRNQTLFVKKEEEEKLQNRENTTVIAAVLCPDVCISDVMNTRPECVAKYHLRTS